MSEEDKCGTTTSVTTHADVPRPALGTLVTVRKMMQVTTYANLPVAVVLVSKYSCRVWRHPHVKTTRGHKAQVERRASHAAERMHHLSTLLLIGGELVERVELGRECGRGTRRAVLDSDAREGERQRGSSRYRRGWAYRAWDSDGSGLALPARGRRVVSLRNAPRPFAAEYW